jgi:serine/threonine-protein kinase
VIADRYRVDAVLATGGMGAVYRATDTRLSRAVAVKVILPELGQNQTQVARFEREAVASARLSHPGIVQVHDFGKTDDGIAYLVMELVEGRTLADVLDDGKLPAPRAVELVDQALVALAAAHAAGIVHRDLKPGNLMVVPIGGGRELLKILDFGIAQLKSGEAYVRLTQTGDVVGTPSFMAPEQARAEPCDARADVYAMGMVLWCCLTGQRPWPADWMIAQIVVAVQTEMPRRADLVVADVPRAVAAVAEKAIAKRPEDRYASAAEMSAALREAARAIPPSTRLPPPATVAQTPRNEAKTAPAVPVALSVERAVATPAPVAAAASAPSAPIVDPVAARVVAPAPLPTPLAAPSSLPAAAAVAAPAPKRPRWWLRILVALGIVGTLGAIGLVLVLVVGWYALKEFGVPTLPRISLPFVPAPVDPEDDSEADDEDDAPSEVATATCAAAVRCCHLAGGGDCDAYAESDDATCRQAIGTYGDAISARGQDAHACSPTYGGP